VEKEEIDDGGVSGKLTSREFTIFALFFLLFQTGCEIGTNHRAEYCIRLRTRLNIGLKGSKLVRIDRR
jgi:hypothetical protein